MVIEIFIAALIFFTSIYIIYKNIKKKSSGSGCDCGSCSAHCSKYEKTK